MFKFAILSTLIMLSVSASADMEFSFSLAASYGACGGAFTHSKPSMMTNFTYKQGK